jgi:hypothetical protein
MRYFELRETAREINDIIKISDALMTAINKAIQINIRQNSGAQNDDDPEDLIWRPSVFMAPARNKDWANSSTKNSPRRFKDVISDEIIEDYWDEISSSVCSMLVGKHDNTLKGSDHATSEIEVGTIDEILRNNDFDFNSVDSNTYNMVKSLWVVLTNNGASKGKYSPNAKNDNDIKKTKEDGMHSLQGEVMISAFWFIKNGRVAAKSIASTIAHELTHAIDDQKSAGRYMMNKRTGQFQDQSKMTNQEYLQSNIEVNARFTQAIKELASKIKADPDLLQRDRFITELNKSFRKHQLSKETLTPEQTQKLIKRALQYFEIK